MYFYRSPQRALETFILSELISWDGTEIRFETLLFFFFQISLVYNDQTNISTDDPRSESTATGVETREQKAGEIAEKPFDRRCQWPVVFTDDHRRPEETLKRRMREKAPLSLLKEVKLEQMYGGFDQFPSAFSDSVKRFLRLRAIGHCMKNRDKSKHTYIYINIYKYVTI